MNALKGLNLKFDVEGCPELSAAIQKRLFALGAASYADKSSRFLYCTEGEFPLTVGWDREFFELHSHTLSTLDDLYRLPVTHTITIDGKDIEVSEESYQNLKEWLL